MDFAVPPELDEVRASFLAFIDRDVRPVEERFRAELQEDRWTDEMRDAAGVLRRKSADIGYYGAHLPEEVGGWERIRDMRMSIGVTYSTARGDYRIYHEKAVDDLLTELQRADLVVGFNNVRFDYEVLHYYTVYDMRQIPTLDVLIDLQEKLQHRLSLDVVARAQ